MMSSPGQQPHTPPCCTPSRREQRAAPRAAKGDPPGPARRPAPPRPQLLHPEEVALVCLAAALVVPPRADAGWGAGFDSQAAQAALAGFLLDELLVTGGGG